MFLNKYLICAAAILIPAMASAAPTRVYCEVTKNEGAFANQLFFEVDGDTAQVVDGIILNVRGKPIPAGRKSVTFRMMFRDPDTTLRHEQVDPQVASVVDRLKAELGAELRT